MKIGDKIKILKDVPELDSNGNVIDKNNIVFKQGEELYISDIWNQYEICSIKLNANVIWYNYSFYKDMGYFELIKDKIKTIADLITTRDWKKSITIKNVKLEGGK